MGQKRTRGKLVQYDNVSQGHIDLLHGQALLLDKKWEEERRDPPRKTGFDLLPPALRACMDWCEEHNPSMVSVLSSAFMANSQGSNAIVTLVLIGFEAGRKFQLENPSVPLGPLT